MSAPAMHIDELAGLPGRILRRGSWKKAEVRLVELDDRSIVIKDWRGASRWLQPLMKRLSRNEQRIYRFLAGLSGIPSLLAAGDRVLVLEHIPGLSIGNLSCGPGTGRVVAARLEKTVRDLHNAGVYHFDLRKRDNILVTEAGHIVVIDFTSAVRFRSQGIVGSFFRPLLGLIDRYAVLKWKHRLTPDALTSSEGRLMRVLDATRFRHREL